jgi:hypothetical protein
MIAQQFAFRTTLTSLAQYVMSLLTFFKKDG